MRVSLGVAVTVVLAAASLAVAGEVRESSALRTAQAGLDRAVSVGSEAFVPRAKLKDASVGQVFFVHDPQTLEAAYGVVPVVSRHGETIGLIGVDADSDRVLWYSFDVRSGVFPPVSAQRAGERVRAAMGLTAREGQIGEGILVGGYDKHFYWRFENASGKAWLVDIDEPEAKVLEADEGSADGILWGRQTEVSAPVRSRQSAAQRPASLARQPMNGGRPASYDIPGIPYHWQITDWYCGPSSLQMIFDHHGQEIGQHNIADVADDIVDWGCTLSNMVRAAHFSGMSIAIQDSSLQGYVERQLGYACPDYFWYNSPAPDRYEDPKNLICSNYPIFVCTWFDGIHSTGHYRVLKGYDDSLHVFCLHDPWYRGSGISGPNILFDQDFFVTDLWAYVDWWGMVTGPWILRPTFDSSVAEGDTFRVDLWVQYPGPYPFDGQTQSYNGSATISLSAGLALAGGASTVSLPALYSGDTTTVSWEVIASGPAGEWGMAFQAQGMIDHVADSYGTYTDSIGGHAYETVEITGTLAATWDPEERLTSGEGSSQTGFPGARSMAVGDDGTIHIVWQETQVDYSGIFYMSRVSDVWQPPVVLTPDSSFCYSPSIDVGSDGSVHVAWVDTRDGNPEIYYKYWTSGGGWSADERVSVYGEVDRHPSIAVGDTAAYIAWESRTGTVGNMHVADATFSQRTALGWSARVDLDPSVFRDTYRPSLFYGVDGLLHAVYERQTANTPNEREKVFHVTWDGMAWSARSGPSSNLSYSRNPVAAVGPDSTVHLVWQDGENTGGDIFYSTYDGISWQVAEQIVSGGTEAGSPSIAVDDDGEVYVAWVDNRHGESELYFMSNDGSGWSDPARLTHAVGASMLPTVGTGGSGSVYVVWTDLRDGNAEIYFRLSEEGSGTRATPDGPLALLDLSAPYPQPFVSEVRFSLTVAHVSDVSVEVFDVTGRRVKALTDEPYGAGIHEISWDGTTSRGEKVSPGVYFVSCTCDLGKRTRRVVMVR